MALSAARKGWTLSAGQGALIVEHYEEKLAAVRTVTDAMVARAAEAMCDDARRDAKRVREASPSLHAAASDLRHMANGGSCSTDTLNAHADALLDYARTDTRVVVTDAQRDRAWKAFVSSLCVEDSDTYNEAMETGMVELDDPHIEESSIFAALTAALTQEDA
jgi:sirohydrochlorin ferrochelatase